MLMEITFSQKADLHPEHASIAPMFHVALAHLLHLVIAGAALMQAVARGQESGCASFFGTVGERVGARGWAVWRGGLALALGWGEFEPVGVFLLASVWEPSPIAPPQGKRQATHPRLGSGRFCVEEWWGGCPSSFCGNERAWEGQPSSRPRDFVSQKRDAHPESHPLTPSARLVILHNNSCISHIC